MGIYDLERGKCMIEWKEKYAVGVETLDNQHRIFFSLINKLESLTGHKAYLDELPLILNEIVEYTTLHFNTEESIMEKVAYPKLDDHRHKHNQIKKDIYLKCKKVIEKEPSTMDVIWLYNYMKDWIKSHILEEDAQYKAHMKDHLVD